MFLVWNGYKEKDRTYSNVFGPFRFKLTIATMTIANAITFHETIATIAKK